MIWPQNLTLIMFSINFDGLAFALTMRSFAVPILLDQPLKAGCAQP
jgi:hypothetical protein